MRIAAASFVLVALLAVVALACTPVEPAVTSSGTSSGTSSIPPAASVSAPLASLSPLSPPEASVAPLPTANPSATAAPTATTRNANERRWEASKDGATVLTISNQPGFIIDGSAPPPVPGQAPAKHPFLSATCVQRDPLLCSRLGGLLRASHSLDEFLAKLQADGFQVGELHPGGF